MKGQIFSTSAEAAAWIVDHLKSGMEILEKEVGGAADYVPILGFCYDYQVWDKDKNLIERYDGEHFGLGWNSTYEMDPGGYNQCEIGGFKVLVHHTTLKELEGKELILEEVQVGYPIPASKKCQLLRARPKESGSGKAEEKI